MDADPGSALLAIEFDGPLQCFTLTSDGLWFVAATDQTLHVRSAHDGKPAMSFPFQGTSCLTTLGDLVAAGCADGTIALWNLRLRSQVGAVVRAHRGRVEHVTLSGRVLTSSCEREALTWDATSLKFLGEQRLGHHARSNQMYWASAIHELFGCELVRTPSRTAHRDRCCTLFVVN